MHTLLLILAGFTLLLLLFGLGRLLGKPFRSLLPYFLLLWFLGAAFNMWVGISQAGYSFAEELPIFVIIFGVPAVAAVFLARKSQPRQQ